MVTCASDQLATVAQNLSHVIGCPHCCVHLLGRRDQREHSHWSRSQILKTQNTTNDKTWRNKEEQLPSQGENGSIKLRVIYQIDQSHESPQN